MIAVLGVLLAIFVVAAPTARGQSSSSSEASSSSSSASKERVQGTLRAEVVKDGAIAREGVAGVKITARTNEREVGTATSDAQGQWAITLPGPGTYSVAIDPATLPKGIKLRDPGATSREVVVGPGDAAGVVFALGEANTRPSAFQQLADLFASGLVFGAVIAMCAVGLSLIFGVTGLVNFAHGELVTFGALVAWFFNAMVGGPKLFLPIAAALGVLAGGLLGGALEWGLFRQLRRRRTGNVSLIVVTIGLGIAGRYIYLMLFEGNPRQYNQFASQSDAAYGPFHLPPKELWLLGIAFAALAGVGWLLLRTRVGTAVRAVADNRDLAASSGIDVQRVYVFVWVLGAALTALGGVLLGLTESVQWDMGYRLLLPMFAAVVLGGLGTAFGAMAGGLTIGLVQEMSTYWFDTDFKLAFALGVLIIILLFRPQGILGTRERYG